MVIAGWSAAGGAIASGVLSALSMSIAHSTKSAVEEAAGLEPHARSLRRAEIVMNDADGHARALRLLRLPLDAVCFGAAIWWAGSFLGDKSFEAIHFVIGLLLGCVMLWFTSVVVATAVARHAGPRLVYSRSTIIRFARLLASPFEFAARGLDEVIRRLIGVEKKDAEERAEQELLQVVEEAEATGALEEDEADMLSAVMRFKDLTVQQIMTPRTDIEAIALTNDLGSLIRQVRDVRHSRIPIYDESLDQIVGIFYVKDLMLWLGGDAARSGKPFDLRSLVRQGYFVPENKTVKDLLKELMEKKVHIAIVADEYGGTAGIVTIEDIVEEVFGDIKDEYESVAAEMPDVVIRLDGRTADLDAAARIIDVNIALESLGVSIPDSDEYDTVGGFVITTLGKIPAKGDTFEHERMVFTIIEAKPTRVVKVQLEVRPEDAAPEVEPQTAAKE